MIAKLTKRRHSPIGMDIGSRSVKLVQLDRSHSRLIEASRWDLRYQDDESPEARDQAWLDAISHAQEGRGFRGRDVVVCLGEDELFLQNIRVTKGNDAEMQRAIRQEAASRLPYPIDEAELRHIDVGDVRQGDAVLHEVILVACRNSVLDARLELLDRARVRPVAIDIEPCAILRGYASQYRRENDEKTRAIYVQVGFSRTAVIIAEGERVLFIKYLELGGSDLDAAIAKHLELSLIEAASLRRNHGDRRADQQDPEIRRSIEEATRDVQENLMRELNLCVRYHNVTFRGHRIDRMVLGGGEASDSLASTFGSRLELTCDIGDPLRTYESNVPGGRRSQWGVAAGLARREMNIEAAKRS